MGGGGGGDPGASARQQEAERQSRIKAATDEINAIFSGKKKVERIVQGPDTYENKAGPKGSMRQIRVAGSPVTEFEWVDDPNAPKREQMYADHKTAVYDLNKRDVDRQATEAEKINRFGLARAGLMGGSADVDSNADLNRRTNEGLIRAGGIADGAAADLQVADERTRSNLISMAQSGIDTGTASSLALQGLKNNADSAASARAGATVGGLFNDLSQAYLYNQGVQGRAAGNQAYQQQWTGVSNPRTGDSGTVSR